MCLRTFFGRIPFRLAGRVSGRSGSETRPGSLMSNLARWEGSIYLWPNSCVALLPRLVIGLSSSERRRIRKNPPQLDPGWGPSEVGLL